VGSAFSSGVPYLAAYCASKAALVVLSQSLRAELHGSGVRVMLVYPGYTESEIFEREKRVGGARRPSGKYAPAAEVAEAIARGIETDARGVATLTLARPEKHQLADPALAARLLGVGMGTLIEGAEGAAIIPRDGTLLGHLFESLVALSESIVGLLQESQASFDS